LAVRVPFTWSVVPWVGSIHPVSTSDIVVVMKLVTISRSGQIPLPIEVRRRWQASQISFEDRGNELILRPIPSDPIGAATGSLAGPGPSTDEARATLRE
jgi:bifunctional DNA-binding transcriptional regulator/antitoxin component of YhaV-PrlF toxin-antitoxin module